MSDDVVFVVIGGHRSRNGIYHDRQDCPALQLSDSVKAKPRSAFPETLRPCQRCVGTIDHADVNQNHSYQEALKQAAADPATAPEGFR
jgi:hypothetical protein